MYMYLRKGDNMEFLMISVVIIAVIAIVIAVVFLVKYLNFPNSDIEPESRRAGRRGEAAAINAIKSVLHDDDLLFTNVEISFEDKRAELDDVIVNRFGVFIIEVKNYRGRLYGNEDDYEWEKYKDDGYGNTFLKKVKNPIKQVKRQVYILAKYLDYYGSRGAGSRAACCLRRATVLCTVHMCFQVLMILTEHHSSRQNRLTKRQVDSIVNLIR